MLCKLVLKLRPKRSRLLIILFSCDSPFNILSRFAGLVFFGLSVFRPSRYRTRIKTVLRPCLAPDRDIVSRLYITGQCVPTACIVANLGVSMAHGNHCKKSIAAGTNKKTDAKLCLFYSCVCTRFRSRRDQSFGCSGWETILI
ncbi:hypothetical protein D3C87_1457790 [compost metagenome]